MNDRGPALLTTAGVALYGAQWQTPLSCALGVSDRTVRRSVAGKSPIPGAVWPELATLCEAFCLELDAIAARLRAVA